MSNCLLEKEVLSELKERQNSLQPKKSIIFTTRMCDCTGWCYGGCEGDCRATCSDNGQYGYK